MSTSLLIKNCRILEKGKLRNTSIFIVNGKIRNLGRTVKASKVIDAKNNIVIPGLIDMHVHFRQPGYEYKEDFYTGSRAAAKGGITSIFDMPNTNPATTSLEALKQKKELAKRYCIINYGFHFGATKNNSKEIIKANTKSVKIYMGSSTGNLLVDKTDDLRNVFRAAKKSGKVCLLHAENEECMQKNSLEYKSKGLDNPEIHSAIRENKSATLAVKDALKLHSEIENKIYFCHTSTKEEIRLIGKAKKKRRRIYCEVTPHHLFLNAKAYRDYGNFVKVNPPLRYVEDQRALWRAIINNIVDVIATDHAPHQPNEKEKNYWEAPSGVPGVETLLPLLLDAVNSKRLKLKKVIELTSENPAKIFGIKNKGKIKLGYDADLVIVDMELESSLEQIESKSKWSPFHDKVLKGWPIVTIINGNIVYYQGQIYNNKGKELEFKNGR